MADAHVLDDLAAYIAGELDREDSRRVEEHIAACRDCAREHAALRVLWTDMGEVRDELPGAGLQKSFRDMLKGYEQGVRQASELRAREAHRGIVGRLFAERAFVRAAMAAVLAAVCLLGGYTLAGWGGSAREIAELREEVHGLGGLLTVSLLHQESASERLKGVSYSEKLAASDPAITRALIATMKSDRSVNVRLAALDALSHDLTDPVVRHEVIQALPAQTSPLMQIALVDLLVQINDQESRDVLKAVSGRPGLVPEVRKRIEEWTGPMTDHAKVTS